MQVMKVEAKRGNKPTVEVEVEMAENLSELVGQYGEEIVFGHARRSIVIALQGFMRSQMDIGTEKGLDDATIATNVVETVKGWKPSQKKAPKTPSEKARDIISRLSPAERAELIREFRGKKEAA